MPLRTGQVHARARTTASLLVRTGREGAAAPHGPRPDAGGDALDGDGDRRRGGSLAVEGHRHASTPGRSWFARPGAVRSDSPIRSARRSRTPSATRCSARIATRGSPSGPPPSTAMARRASVTGNLTIRRRTRPVTLRLRVARAKRPADRRHHRDRPDGLRDPALLGPPRRAAGQGRRGGRPSRCGWPPADELTRRSDRLRTASGRSRRRAGTVAAVRPAACGGSGVARPRLRAGPGRLVAMTTVVDSGRRARRPVGRR